jgi:hypothetical protein
MQTVLEINEATAAKLRSIATAKNISVDALLNACIPGLQSDSNLAGDSADADLRELNDWIEALPDTPVLSDEAINRASIHSDR